MGSRGGGFLSLVVANGAIYNRIVIPGTTRLSAPHRGPGRAGAQQGSPIELCPRLCCTPSSPLGAGLAGLGFALLPSRSRFLAGAAPRAVGQGCASLRSRVAQPQLLPRRPSCSSPSPVPSAVTKAAIWPLLLFLFIFRTQEAAVDPFPVNACSLPPLSSHRGVCWGPSSPRGMLLSPYLRHHSGHSPAWAAQPCTLGSGHEASWLWLVKGSWDPMGSLEDEARLGHSMSCGGTVCPQGPFATCMP